MDDKQVMRLHQMLTLKLNPKKPLVINEDTEIQINVIEARSDVTIYGINATRAVPSYKKRVYQHIKKCNQDSLR